MKKLSIFLGALILILQACNSPSDQQISDVEVAPAQQSAQSTQATDSLRQLLFSKAAEQSELQLPILPAATAASVTPIAESDVALIDLARSGTELQTATYDPKTPWQTIQAMAGELKRKAKGTQQAVYFSQVADACVLHSTTRSSSPEQDALMTASLAYQSLRKIGYREPLVLAQGLVALKRAGMITAESAQEQSRALSIQTEEVRREYDQKLSTQNGLSRSASAKDAKLGGEQAQRSFELRATERMRARAEQAATLLKTL